MSKLNQKSWGVKYELKSVLKPMGNYTFCPYEPCGHYRKTGFLSCIVGYDKDFDILIVRCPACSRHSKIHGLESTFHLLELRAGTGQFEKEAGLEWLEYPKTYEAMRQCIEEILKEYENLLRPHLEMLKSKLGRIPAVNSDSSWDLGDEQLNCFSRANNLEMLQDILEISDLEAEEIRRKVTEELTSPKEGL
ncbi:MAG: hypothetical protein AAB358_03955 [Patescibacteria group bacterium]